MNGKATQWLRSRGRFNHDWVKNRFLLTVGSFLSSASGEGYPVEETLPPLIELMKQWPERRDMLDRLLDEFETTMSPATLFHAPPLNGLNAATREWLKPAIHLLWWKGRGNESLLKNVYEARNRADKEYERLKAELRSARADAEIRKLEVMAKILYGEFQDLSEAIHQLPSKIQAV